MALAAFGLWLFWIADIHSPGAILLLVGIGGTLAGLNSPSWQAFVPELVPREDLLSAITLNSLQFNAARALGPTAAGIVLATLGPGPAFLLNAAVLRLRARRAGARAAPRRPAAGGGDREGHHPAVPAGTALHRHAAGHPDQHRDLGADRLPRQPDHPVHGGLRRGRVPRRQRRVRRAVRRHGHRGRGGGADHQRMGLGAWPAASSCARGCPPTGWPARCSASPRRSGSASWRCSSPAASSWP